MFIGYSKQHSSLVPLCLNVQTGKITPQFHVIFDDKFETVVSLPHGDTLQDERMDIFRFDRNCFIDDESYTDQNTHLPLEFVQWFQDGDTGESIHTDVSEHIHPQCRPQVFDFNDAIEVVDGTADLDGVPEGATLGLPSSLDEASEGVAGIHPVPNGDVQDDIASLHEETEGAHDDHPPTVTNNGRPTRNVGTWKDGPANTEISYR